MGCVEGSCCCGGSGGEQRHDAPGLNRRDFIQRAALLAGSAGVIAGASDAGAAEVSGETARALAAAREAAESGQAERYAAPVSRDYNGPYAGANLNRVAFPIGGIGAGMFCLEGTGAISHMSVRNRMEVFHEP